MSLTTAEGSLAAQSGRGGRTYQDSRPVAPGWASVDFKYALGGRRQCSGKGAIMTDSSGFEEPVDEAAAREKPDEEELRGRYVEGNYGAAGTESGRHADDTEGQYIEGDYGAAGAEGGLPEPLGSHAAEAGRFVKGDYDGAGTAPGRTAENEVGRYTEGDYGTDGTVEPTRKASEPTDGAPTVDE